MTRVLLVGVLTAVACFGSAESGLVRARDAQDRPSMEKILEAAEARAEKNSKDADAQYQFAIAASYVAEVALEMKDKPAAKRAAEEGIKGAEAAVALKPSNGEYFRLLATLYGQAIQDMFSALSYGKKSKDAMDKAKELEPKSAEVWVADAVGNYYMPASFGGGPDPAIVSLKRALGLDPNNAEAWLWLGLAQRKKHQDPEARKSFEKSLELNPNRVWARQQLAKTPAQ